MSSEPIQVIKLPDGQIACLFRSEESSVENGTHLILQYQNPDLPRTEKNDSELLDTARTVATKYASEPGGWRIAMNGERVGKMTHAHVHIILPTGDDYLPRLVDQFKKPVG